ncbi:MAG: peptidoglycan editing factor PgeF [Betaproteobacteria bacterium]
MTAEFIVPEWAAPAAVRALVTTRALGDAKDAQVRARLRQRLPAEPRWLRQVHGTTVLEAPFEAGAEADASFTRVRGEVCVVMAADCMPVLFATDDGSAVGAAHAGWRGLCAGVIEATVASMGARPALLHAWLGPAIGPTAYEVGDEVRAAFVARDAHAASAFAATRPGHWLLDLYAIARRRLAVLGVERVSGGGHCTHADRVRFYSYRRDRATERMAAMVWIA